MDVCSIIHEIKQEKAKYEKFESEKLSILRKWIESQLLEKDLIIDHLFYDNGKVYVDICVRYPYKTIYAGHYEIREFVAENRKRVKSK